MTKTTRARYTLEFKQEAVRLVEGNLPRIMRARKGRMSAGRGDGARRWPPQNPPG